ncbi:MAG: response regulator [Planctomycetota bacterium]|nr:MAG: response regulator [Planctomycetota bacterium]
MKRLSVLVVGQEAAAIPLGENCEVVRAVTLGQALSQLRAGSVDAMLLGQVANCPASLVLEAGGLLEKIPDGLALLDIDTRIIWCNRHLQQLSGKPETIVGQRFFEAFPTHSILGPDFEPLSSAIGTGEPASTTMRLGDKCYLTIDVTPLQTAANDPADQLIVTARDSTQEYIQRQKLEKIHQAGLALGDLQPDEVSDLSEEDRIELLKSQILESTEEILGYESVEIRLLERETGELRALLAIGFVDEAVDRKLYALPEGNGVTGFVAATGRSYLCLDTQEDKKYIVGAAGARSSITVPLVLRNEILGTFNVESPRPGAFGDNDLQFLELFCREVARALNTLELLVAEQTQTAAENTSRILCEVADPVDEILNAATWLREKVKDEDPRVAARLQEILVNARGIRQSILSVGNELLKTNGHSLAQTFSHNSLKGKRILIVDADKEIRRLGHEILGRFGCNIETAHDAAEALMMARTHKYDVVIADIRLPDIKADQLFLQLRGFDPLQQVILMAGFGYDANHTIVKARQMGLQSVIYKPFRREQLLKALDLAITSRAQAEAEARAKLETSEEPQPPPPIP